MAINYAFDINNASNIPDKIMYVSKPVWLNEWFIIAIVITLFLICVAIYAWFRISLRNRLNVIIHMPDKTRRTFAYKNFKGDTFNILSPEKDKDGNEVMHRYFFRPDCLETGYFGRYIEYDYAISEPRGKPLIRDNQFFKFISGLLNTQLAIDLLLSQKFKEFVKFMLVIILVAIIITAVLAAIPLFYHPIMKCELVGNNNTLSVIKAGVMLR